MPATKAKRKSPARKKKTPVKAKANPKPRAKAKASACKDATHYVVKQSGKSYMYYTGADFSRSKVKAASWCDRKVAKDVAKAVADISGEVVGVLSNQKK